MPVKRGAHAGNDETQDLDAVNADSRQPRRGRVAADRLDFLADRGPLDQRPEPPTTSAITMIGFGTPNSQRPRESCRNVRHAGHDRNAAE